ncbi:MAG: hypothetical protein MK041_12975 [Aquabacterium sp.]|nr:hypothetical protein [Aquabacterium sp.]
MAHHHGQPVEHQRAVGQAGEDVVVGQALQRLLVALVHGHVAEDADVVRDPALRIAHAADAQQLGIDRAVAAAVPDLAAPLASLGQRLPHRAVEGLVLAAGGEHGRRAAQHVLARVAGDGAEGGVDLNDAALQVGDDHAFAGVVEDAGGHAPAFVGRQRAAQGADAGAHRAGRLGRGRG